jgi:hypothetical protein
MKKILMLSALAEAGTGVILILSPSTVVRLLFAAEILGAGVLMSRLAGIALVSLAVACWPGTGSRRAFEGMLTYSTLAALYLIRIGFKGQVGGLLWTAVAVHAILSIVLAGAWLRERKG